MKDIRSTLCTPVARRMMKTMLVAALAVTLIPALPTPAHADSKKVRLFVDPGHGGKDPGAVSGSAVEKDIALAISKDVVEAAKRQGWDVKMSRDKDVFIPLPQRPAMAKKWGATSYVSVHSNSTGNKMLGNMTIYRSTEGKKLGGSIMKELAKLTEYDDIGNRKDVRGLAVLKHAEMPATLVEVLSVSPAAERKRLNDPAFRKQAAEAIVKGVAAYEGVEYKAPEEPVKKNVPKKDEAPRAETTESPKPEAETTPAPRPTDKPETVTEPTSEATEERKDAAREDATSTEAERTRSSQPVKAAEQVAEAAGTETGTAATGLLTTLLRLLGR